MIAVISYALYSAYVDKANDYTGAEITYVMLIAGAVVFVVIAILKAMINGTTMHLVTLPVQNSAFLAAVLYQSLCCSILAFFLSNVAIARIGVNRTSSFIGIATVVSIVSGTLILKETISGSQIAGAVIILIGVYIANAKMTADG